MTAPITAATDAYDAVITLCAIGGAKHGLYPAGELWECQCGAMVCPDCHKHGELCDTCAESKALDQADRREQMRKV